jgi:hypothetical protein
MKILTGKITFPKRKGSVSKAAPVVHPMSGVTIKTAFACVTGFKAAFSGPNDHHFGELEVKVEANFPRTVRGGIHVHGTLGLRDRSGEWDDEFEGEISYMVFYETE